MKNSVPFNPDSDIINELATYGVITKGTDRKCEGNQPDLLVSDCPSVQTGSQRIGGRLFSR